MLAHFWVAFVAFLGAIVLGEWQMYVRSPLAAWVNNPEHYYRSVTAHGTVMAYVMPTLVAMGFGYAIVELALKRPLIGLRWAWGGFWLVVAGHGDGRGDDGRGQGVGAVHVLSADDRQPVLLLRRRAGRRRLVDLGRADVDQPQGMEEGQPGRDRYRWRCSATWPAPTCGPGRRSAPPSKCWCSSFRPRSGSPTPSTPGWRASSSRGRCTPSSTSG